MVCCSEMNRKSFFILASIVLLSLPISFYRLGEIPNGFHRDEAFLGYNAYSLLKTGKDINGNLLPTHLESFLYTPAGYSYFAIPAIVLIGLNEFAVRIPSAVFSVGTSVVIYFLTKKLLFQTKAPLLSKHRESISLLASFFYATTPWNIVLARTASVITVVVFFIALGMMLSLYWVETKKRLLLVSAFLAFFLSLCFYVAPYLFLLLFLPFFFLLIHKKIPRHESLVLGVCYIFFIVLPSFLTFTSESLSLRVRSLSITNSPYVSLVLAEEIREDGVSNTPLFLTRVFHNKIVGLSQYFFETYSKHFSYQFFFTDQSFPDRYRVPLSGMLYLILFPLTFMGAYILFRTERSIALVLFAWIFLAPIGSSLASDDVPNIQRTLFMLPPLLILTALGGFFLYQSIQNNKRIYVLVPIIVFAVWIYSFVFFLHQYFVHGQRYRPWYRQEGYRQLVARIGELSSQFGHIVITDRESAPTIFFLFYNHYNPLTFQQETRSSVLRDFDRVSFGKYTFSQEECPLKLLDDREESQDSNTLYINSGLCKLPDDVTVHDEVKRTDGSVAFYILSLKESR